LKGEGRDRGKILGVKRHEVLVCKTVILHIRSKKEEATEKMIEQTVEIPKRVPRRGAKNKETI